MISLMKYNQHKFINKGKLTFGEDKYQQDTAIKDGNNKISSPAICVFSFDIENKEQVKDVIDTIAKRTVIFTHTYFKKYKKVYEKIKKVKMIRENHTNNIYDNFDIIMPDPIIIIYSYDQQKIMIAMDHIYIGGYFFMEWSTYAFSGDKLTPYKLNYTPGLTELNSLRFILMDAIPSYIRTKNDLPLFDNDDQIKRYTLKLDANDLKKKHNSKEIKMCIIYEIAIVLLRYSTIHRKLNILIPVAFENTDYIFNNVGAIFISVSKDDTVSSITKKVKNNLYHTIATNHLMQIVHAGSGARSTIDAIMTIGYTKNPKLVNDHELSRIEVSFNTMCKYAFYCTSFTFGDTINITFTIMTPKFAIKKFLKNEKDIKPAFNTTI